MGYRVVADGETRLLVCSTQLQRL